MHTLIPPLPSDTVFMSTYLPMWVDDDDDYYYLNVLCFLIWFCFIKQDRHTGGFLISLGVIFTLVLCVQSFLYKFISHFKQGAPSEFCTLHL